MKNKIEEKYKAICNDKASDIYYHMPVLKKYADECNLIYELGVRACSSVYAFMLSLQENNLPNRKVVSVDKDRWEQVNEAEQIAKEAAINWTFLHANDLEIEIPECDMIFIDTWHVEEQIQKELELHGNKAKKFLAFHDTTTFAINGEDCRPGIMPSIKKFMDNNPHWILDYQTAQNNGLLILKRYEV